MKAYVAKAFKEWGWGTDKDFSLHIENKKGFLIRSEVASLKNQNLRAAKISENKEEIQQLKRERKQYRSIRKCNMVSLNFKCECHLAFQVRKQF